MKNQIILQLMFLLIFSTFAVANTSPEKAPDSYLRDVIITTKNNNKNVQIDLYVMSQCPYGVNAEKALIPILKEMEENATFNIFFIANQKSDNEFSALHGESEVLENRRQLIIKRHFNTIVRAK